MLQHRIICAPHPIAPITTYQMVFEIVFLMLTISQCLAALRFAGDGSYADFKLVEKPKLPSDDYEFGHRFLERDFLQSQASVQVATGETNRRARDFIAIPSNNRPFATTAEKAELYSATTSGECSVEVDLASQCVSGLTSGQECADCINSVFDGLPNYVTCSSFERQICSAIDTCGCTACREELEDLYSCSVDESCEPIDCSTSESDESFCQNERNIVEDCIGDMSTCKDCLNSAMDAMFVDGNSISCFDFIKGICPAIVFECDCGTCGQVLENFYSCFLVEGSEGNCAPLNCMPPNMIPKQTLSETLICQEELSTLNACVPTIESCGSCIDAAYDDMYGDKEYLSCSEFTVGMCPAIEGECDCGSCRQYLEEFYSCILKDGSQGDCNLACNTSDSYTSTQSADPVGTYTPARTTKPGLINTDEGLPSTADRGAWLLALCVTTAGTLGSLVYSK